jgi:hypothetical protein
MPRVAGVVAMLVTVVLFAAVAGCSRAHDAPPDRAAASHAAPASNAAPAAKAPASNAVPAAKPPASNAAPAAKAPASNAAHAAKAPASNAAPAPNGALTCRALQRCTESCADAACADACVARLASAARPAYDALQACVVPACARPDDAAAPCRVPGSFACKLCVVGHCAEAVSACLAH